MIGSRTRKCAFIVMAVLACDSSQTGTAGGSTASPPAEEWYSGGTLHRRTVGEWRTATYENRLATSADFVMTVGDYSSLPSDLRSRAQAFESCITGAVSDGNVDDKAVSEIAATCAVLLGY